jgi:hypothetical protein
MRRLNCDRICPKTVHLFNVEYDRDTERRHAILTRHAAGKHTGTSGALRW